MWVLVFEKVPQSINFGDFYERLGLSVQNAQDGEQRPSIIFISIDFCTNETFFIILFWKNV